MKKYISFNLLILLFSIFSCSKKGDSPVPTPTPNPNSNPKTCIISGISLQNSGSKSEFSLTIQYDGSLNPIKFNLFDSLSNLPLMNANLNYVTSDSISIDAYQYFKLDASKRVIVFVTKEDISIPTLSDTYRFEYKYSNDGFLVTKLLYINGARIPQYTTNYTYANGLLISCLMTASSSDNKKVLESNLTYDANMSPKTMIYTFPDGFESSVYSVALNYGTRPIKALSKIITKVYDAFSGNIIDIWTTNYSNYLIDSNGYISSGSSFGDQQQGIFTFYGKTKFVYKCQ